MVGNSLYNVKSSQIKFHWDYKGLIKKCQSMKSKICSIDVCASLKALKNTNQQNTNLFIAKKSFLGSDWEVGTTSDVDEYPLKWCLKSDDG